MSSDETWNLLQEGITAAKAGERAKAREALQRVVEADENNAQAWLWLSEVVTTFEDREVCLENVLALDPNNEPARKGLEWVHAQIAATPEIEPPSILPHIETDQLRAQEARVKFDFSGDEFDSPLLCVYCGRLTNEDDTRCPQCGRRLYHSALKRERPAWVWVAWVVGIVDTLASLGMLLVLLMILAGAITAARFGNRSVDVIQLALMYFGESGSIPAQAQTAVLTVLPREIFFFRLGYSLFAAIVTLGLPSRKRVFHLLYIAGVALGALLLYFNANINRVFISSGAATTGLQGIVQVLIFEVLGVFITATTVLIGLLLLLKGIFVFLMEDDFAVATERLWSVIDQNVRESTTAFIRAKNYMKRNMWTLAAMYLRKGITLQPTLVEYHLALAESYAHLGRYRQSLDVLTQAERLQPDSAVIHQLRDVIVGLESQASLKAYENLPPVIWDDYDE